MKEVKYKTAVYLSYAYLAAYAFNEIYLDLLKGISVGCGLAVCVIA